MKDLRFWYEPQQMITRQQAMDYCTQEIFASNGHDDKVSITQWMAAYRAFRHCPADYFEEPFGSFEVFDIDEYDLKILLRELCFIQDCLDGKIPYGRLEQSRNVLFKIEEMLVEMLEPYNSQYVDIENLTVTPLYLMD